MDATLYTEPVVHLGSNNLYWCTRKTCEGPMVGCPEVSIRDGDGRWRHYHVECQPTQGNG